MGSNLNVVSMIFDGVQVLENAIHLLLGLVGLYQLYFAYQLYSGIERAERTGRAT